MGESRCPVCDDVGRLEMEDHLRRLIAEFDDNQSRNAEVGRTEVAEAWASARIALENALYGHG